MSLCFRQSYSTLVREQYSLGRSLANNNVSIKIDSIVSILWVTGKLERAV